MGRRRRDSVRSSWLAATILVAVACNPSSPTQGPTGTAPTGIRGSVTAGPTCPVQANPPEPDCAPRLVAGATIVIRDGVGAQTAAAVSGADGSFSVAIAAGDYVIDPLPVPGLLGTAQRQPVEVTRGSMTTVRVDYDTGIR